MIEVHGLNEVNEVHGMIEANETDSLIMIEVNLWLNSQGVMDTSRIHSMKLVATIDDEPYKPYDVVYGRLLMAVYRVDPRLLEPAHLYRPGSFIHI